ncbi:hypothetical protein FRC10_011994, partial [Ceratobasidium sp. 414]
MAAAPDPAQSSATEQHGMDIDIPLMTGQGEQDMDIETPQVPPMQPPPVETDPTPTPWENPIVTPTCHQPDIQLGPQPRVSVPPPPLLPPSSLTLPNSDQPLVRYSSQPASGPSAASSPLAPEEALLQGGSSLPCTVASPSQVLEDVIDPALLMDLTSSVFTAHPALSLPSAPSHATRGPDSGASNSLGTNTGQIVHARPALTPMSFFMPPPGALTVRGGHSGL